MIVIPGTDKEFDVTLVDDSDTAIPYSSLFDYQFIIYYVIDGVKTQMWTFEKSGTGEREIRIDLTTTNKAYAIVNRKITSMYEDKKIYLEVKVKATSTSSFIDLKAVEGESDLYLFDIGKSANKKAMI